MKLRKEKGGEKGKKEWKGLKEKKIYSSYLEGRMKRNKESTLWCGV